MIDSFTSSPISNFTTYDQEAWDRYRFWMLEQCREGLPSAKQAKKVLGKQDYCWRGSVQNWVWERKFTSEGEEFWWRLFASKRGFTLEMETTSLQFTDPRMRQIARDCLEQFLENWNALAATT